MIDNILYTVVSNSDTTLNTINIDPNSDYDKLIKSQVFGAINSRCLTCSGYQSVCNGHYGKVLVNTPIVKPAYISFIEYVVPYLCFHCGIKIKITPVQNKILLNTVSKHYKHTVESLKQTLKTYKYEKCRNCGSSSLKIKYNKEYGIFYINKVNINMMFIYLLLKLVPFHFYVLILDCKVPFEEFFWYPYFPIPPLFIRQDLSMFKGRIYNSMLTHHHINFVSKISSFNPGILQQIACDIELSKEEAPNSHFCQTLLGKNNFIRNLINGVRRDGTSRVVLNVNKTCLLNAVVFCKEYYTSMPEAIFINKYSLELVKKYYDDNKIISHFSSVNNKLYQVNKGANKPLPLNGGDYIEILCGDDPSPKPILIFRYPCLHKLSIASSLLFNSTTNDSNAITTYMLPGLNGDQDGDDINSAHLKNPKSKYELLEVMSPNLNLISDVSGGLSYGFIQTEVIMFKRLHMETLTTRDLSYIQRIFGKLEPCSTYNFNQILDIIVKQSFSTKKNLKYRFVTSNKNEVVYNTSINTLFKNIQDYENKLVSINVFQKLSLLCKHFLDKYKMSFMHSDIYKDYDFYKECNYQSKNNIQMINSKNMTSSEYSKYLAEYFGSMNKFYINKYEEYIKDKDPLDNNFVLAVLTGIKINPDLIVNYFINSKSTNPRNPEEDHYYGRYAPVFKYNSRDIRSYGYHMNAQGFGFDLISILNVVYFAQSTTVISNLGTAASGAVSRHLHKNLQDIIIDNFRFVTYYNIILDTTLNVHKLPSNMIYILKLDHNYFQQTPTNKYEKECFDLYFQIRKHFVVNTRTISNKYSFPIDIEFIKNSLIDSDKKLLPDDKLNNIKSFVDHIHMNYLFRFGSYRNLLFMYLYSFKDLEISNQALTNIFMIIEKKYKRTPDVGTPQGLISSTAVSESVTQTTISSFHTSTKSGETINLENSSNNIKYMYLRKESINGQCIITTTNPDDLNKLIIIKQGIQYVNLSMLGLELKDDIYTLSKDKCDAFHIQPYMIDIILEKWLAQMNFIPYVYITMLTNYSFKLETDKPYNMLNFIIPFFFKGVYDSAAFIKEIIAWDKTKQYELYIDNDNHTILMDFDTKNLIIDIPVENYTKYFGKSHLFNKLKISYNLSGDLFPNHFRLLSKFQCRGLKPSKFRKSDENILPTLAKLAYEKQYNDLQEAAVKNKFESTRNIESSMFLNQPIPIGHCYYKAFLDIGYYLSNSKIKQEILEAKIPG